MTKKQKETFYITTPIYYPSGKWHIGHCYTTVCCDAVARFKRMEGFDVYYLTGTDEHGMKIEKRALEAGVSPKAFVDGLVGEIKELWKLLDISYDGFIRTTDENHKAAVQKIFTRLYEQGDIYKGKYTGKYCVPCEAFWTPSQLKDGKCPDCGREVIESTEECYFFRLSKYEKRIRELLENTDFLEPKSRVHEMVNNFLSGGLEDVAVSRTSFKWGIPVPFDTDHVIYVWIDALTNYITALGYEGSDDTLFKKYWPADLHMMSKEIVRFHTIIWPAILLALGLELPKKVYSHGWIMFDGDKMSKSKGNVVDPFTLENRYGSDAVRHFLLRDISFGSDANYSSELFLSRYNTDLCNSLGNLVKRTLAMNAQYFGSKVEKGGAVTPYDGALIEKLNALKNDVSAKVDSLRLSQASETIFNAIGAANKYIDETKPWILFKESKTDELKTVIYNLLEAIRISVTMLMPFLTKTPAKILRALGVDVPQDFVGAVYGAQKSYKTSETESLFPRIDIQKELAALGKLATAGLGEPEKTDSGTAPDNAGGGKASKEQPPKTAEAETGIITIDEFFKTELKVAEVIAAERVEKADKLLKLTLKVGDSERTVVSGIAMSYSPDELIGKEVVVVANLKPAKLRGIMSEGMILCATAADGKPIIVSPEKAVGGGAKVC